MPQECIGTDAKTESPVDVSNSSAGGATGSELPSSAVLRVRVQDPRLAKPIKPLAGVTESQSLPTADAAQLSDYRRPLPLHPAHLFYNSQASCWHLLGTHFHLLVKAQDKACYCFMHGRCLTLGPQGGDCFVQGKN